MEGGNVSLKKNLQLSDEVGLLYFTISCLHNYRLPYQETEPYLIPEISQKEHEPSVFIAVYLQMHSVIR